MISRLRRNLPYLSSLAASHQVALLDTTDRYRSECPVRSVKGHDAVYACSLPRTGNPCRGGDLWLEAGPFPANGGPHEIALAFV